MSTAAPKFYRDLDTDFMLDIFQRLLADIPAIAKVLATTHASKFSEAFASIKGKNTTPYRLVIFMPTLGGTYPGVESAIARVPGIKVGGFGLRLSFALKGGRFWGLGFKKDADLTGYQFFRLDWHKSQFKHKDDYHKYWDGKFQGNDYELHWEVPSSPNQAKTTWPTT